MQSDYEEASNVLKKARDSSSESVISLVQLTCSRSLGDILGMQSNYEEASNVLKKAQDQFIGIGDSAWCSSMLTKA